MDNEISEVIVFKTLVSAPEDITSLISCSPEFIKAVISLLTDLLEQVEAKSETRVVH